MALGTYRGVLKPEDVLSNEILEDQSRPILARPGRHNVSDQLVVLQCTFWRVGVREGRREREREGER